MLASLKRSWAVALGATVAASLAFSASPANADLLDETVMVSAALSHPVA